MFRVIGNGAFASAIKYIFDKKKAEYNSSVYEWIVPCVPSYALEDIELENGKKYILISKGLTLNSLLVTEWARSKNLDFVYVAGPHLAKEILEGLPTTTTIAGSYEYFTNLKEFFPSSNYSLCIDFIALAGVIKNVVAYACGTCARKRLGENFRASVINQGFKELLAVASFLAVPYDLVDIVQPGVFSDFILTANSEKSRNFMAGYQQITGKQEEVLIESMHSVDLLMKRINFSEKWPLISSVAKIMNGTQIEFTDLI